MSRRKNKPVENTAVKGVDYIDPSACIYCGMPATYDPDLDQWCCTVCPFIYEEPINRISCEWCNHYGWAIEVFTEDGNDHKLCKECLENMRRNGGLFKPPAALYED